MLENLNDNNFKEYIDKGLKLVMIGSDLCQYFRKEGFRIREKEPPRIYSPG